MFVVTGRSWVLSDMATTAALFFPQIRDFGRSSLYWAVVGLQSIFEIQLPLQTLSLGFFLSAYFPVGQSSIDYQFIQSVVRKNHSTWLSFNKTSPQAVFSERSTSYEQRLFTSTSGYRLVNDSTKQAAQHKPHFHTEMCTWRKVHWILCRHTKKQVIKCSVAQTFDNPCDS